MIKKESIPRRDIYDKKGNVNCNSKLNKIPNL